jgi:hypothetical protein
MLVVGPFSLAQQINTNVMLVNNTQRTIKAAMGPLPPITTASDTDAAPVSPFKGNNINKALSYASIRQATTRKM